MLTGRRLGVYEVRELLGAGAMGEVYRARDAKLGRDVAIKILPRAFTAEPDRLARFEREARMLASLNHPNIGAIYGLEESDDVRALVLELVEGETLAEKLAQGSGLKAQQALAIARQIADAMDAAHERGIVHRDLKPANIKITPDGVVKVLDFGLAKTATGDVASSDAPTMTIGATREGIVLGTVAYMSPEQARGRPVDKRTDIWAFGCVLYEMLTGQAAFPGPTVSDTIAAILEREPDWTLLPPGTPTFLRRLLARCLAKDAKRRLRDIGDASFEPDADAPAPSAGVDRRGAVLWVAAILALVAAGSVALLRPGGAGTSSAPRIVRAARVTNTPESEYGAAISPDGKWIAYYSNARGRTDLWVKFLDSGATLNLTASLNLDLPVRAALGGVDISPDGASIAFSARQTTVGNPALGTWVIPAPVGGVPRKVAQDIQAPRWSPDGKQIVGMIAGATAGDALWVVNADGSNPHEVVPRAGGRHLHFPVWSRDAKFIYFINSFHTWHDEPSEIWRVPAAGGEPEPVARNNRRAVHPAPLPDGSLLFAANPSTVDMGLWWQPAGGGTPVALTNGVGEHTDAYVSSDGKRAIATLNEMHQSLVALPVRFDQGGATERPLTNGYTGDLYPAVDPTGNRLIFSSSRSGSRNLWLARPDGTQATPLTSETALDERPAFSPDGQRVAFVSDRGGERGIWIVNVDGGAPRRLATATVLDTLAWSPDGKRILFARPAGALPRLASVSTDDGSTVEVPTTGAAHSPAWSAATNLIAYLEPTEPTATVPSRTYVALMDAHGQRVFPDLPRTVAFQNGFLAWAPDGHRIAAVSVQANLPAAIWIVEPAAAMPFRQLVELPVSVRPRGIAWNADGSEVIVAKQESASDIVLFDLAK